MAAGALAALLKRDRLVVAASLAGLFLLSWLFLIHLASEMDTMEGIAARMMGMPVGDRISEFLALTMAPAAATFADAGVTFALVALMWIVMMVGMMLPSAAPTILLFAALERRRPATAPLPRIALFTAGYFLAWGAFSILAAALQTALYAAGFLSMQMAATNAFLGGGIFILAGLFEFTPLKNRCLVHCRSPLAWIPNHMRPGRVGALLMGMEHGVYCVGCCWVLMALLFVGGVMNFVWVAVIAAFVLVQKIVPGGVLLARVAGVALILGGAALIARPFLSV